MLDEYEEVSVVQRLARDVRRAGQLDVNQARYLVDAYYAIQGFRLQAANQNRTAEETTEVTTWLYAQMRLLETELQRVLGAWAGRTVPGCWLQSIVGIGPVLSAGFLAHINIVKAPTVGHIWRFAGLDPTLVWGKGQKRPWNADLKRICWLAGDSFVKVSNRPDAIYGQLYRDRKALEVERNESGMFAEIAAETLKARDIKEAETRKAYEAGKLPAGRLDLRARRYAVKIMLAHLHHVLYEEHYGEPPPKPYVLEHIPGHAHFIQPPNWPLPMHLVPGGMR